MAHITHVHSRHFTRVSSNKPSRATAVWGGHTCRSTGTYKHLHHTYRYTTLLQQYAMIQLVHNYSDIQVGGNLACCRRQHPHVQENTGQQGTAQRQIVQARSVQATSGPSS